MWNWLVKRRQVFTVDFTIQGWFHFICFQGCLSLCMFKIWGGCAQMCATVLFYALRLPFSQLYICHAISPFLYTVIFDTCLTWSSEIACSILCLGRWRSVGVPEQQCVLLYQFSEVVWEWQLHYLLWKWDKWRLVSLSQCVSNMNWKKNKCYYKNYSPLFNFFPFLFYLWSISSNWCLCVLLGPVSNECV